MLKSVNFETFVEAGKATRFGPSWPGKRCLAKNRKGGFCQCPAMKGRERCQLHGGKSAGPTSAQGRERVRTANLKHGKRSRSHLSRVKQIRADLKRVTRDLRWAGLIP